MSKPIAVLSSLFGKSHKAISEKLSTEEFNEFTQEATELSTRLEDQKTENELAVGDLATANASIATLNASVSTLTASLATANTQLTAVTTERNTYKAHYDQSANKGDKEGGEDENSRKSELADYNQNALDVWHKAHAKA